MLSLLAKCAGPLSVTYSRPHNKAAIEKRVILTVSELSGEIDRKFSEERMEGFDFDAFLPEIGKTLIGNHDGEFYLK